MEIYCKALIFDLDGTLVDSENVINESWEMWCNKYGVDYDKAKVICHGRPAVESMRLLLDNVSNEMIEDLLKFEVDGSIGLIPLKGAVDFLKSIPKKYWAIATSGCKKLATSRITYSGIPMPDYLITIEDVNNGKPSPEPFLKAAEKLGVSIKDCLIFEDSEAGLKGAIASGAKVIGINIQDKNIMKNKVEYHIKDYTDLGISIESEKIVVSTKVNPRR